jgi:C-terminal processing protease CtpA/Prc
MRTPLLIAFVVLTVFVPPLSAPSPLRAQPLGREPDGPIDAARAKAAVQGLAQALRKRYVFPDAGERYANSVLTRLAAGGYRATTASAFAEAVNKDLQAVRKDRHLWVRFDPDFVPVDPAAEPTAAEKARDRRMAAWRNFGVEKVERLPGNIALLDLRGFLPIELSASALAAAMNLVAGSNALIIDLRQNGGGHPETVAFLCTYLFAEDKEAIHLNDIYDRPENKTRQYWTESTVPGARYADKPVYLLTSARTFSAAEEFSYNLQVLKRATLVGETTGGGAHPGDVLAIGGGFVAFIPSGRAINPVTRTNWEGVGVKPDIAAPAAQAVKVAHLAALRTLLKSEQDSERRQLFETAISRVEHGEPPPSPARP